MVNQELVNWIKSEEAQGYSEKALTKVLAKQNYSTKEIQDAFNLLKEKQNKISSSISSTLLAGLGFVSLVLAAIILSIIIFSLSGKISGYFLMILAGAAMGYYIFYIKQKINATERLGAIFGIFSPALSLILIITSLKILQKLSEQLKQFATGDQQVGGIGMLGIFNVSIDPIISGILYYLFCNVFVIISIIKNKEYPTFLWYLLAPTLFFVLWLVIDLFASQVMRTPLS